MRRTHVRWERIGAAALAAALSVGLLAGRAGAGQSHPAPARVFVVTTGDTLWAIARRVVGPAADPRPVVDQLVRANHLRGATIHPGQRLVLPGS